MPALMIKNLSETLHQQLKERARTNHRSMAQEALTILESGLNASVKRPLPPITRGKFPLTNAWINRAKREGRE